MFASVFLSLLHLPAFRKVFVCRFSRLALGWLFSDAHPSFLLLWELGKAEAVNSAGSNMNIFVFWFAFGPRRRQANERADEV